jgi:hypothetical protein
MAAKRKVNKLAAEAWKLLFNARMYLADEYFLGGGHWSDVTARDAFSLICETMQEIQVVEERP